MAGSGVTRHLGKFITADHDPPYELAAPAIGSAVNDDP
jgi:hypothetical protein